MKITNQVALNKLQQYCAYQDRCHAEVRSKLLSLKVYGEELEEIMAALIDENYLDELRYAKSYVRGKFNIKKWGRNKIIQHLNQNQISDYCIRKALLEIEEDAYIETLREVFTKKYESLDENLSEFIRKNKSITYCLSRGFEMDIIMKIN